MKVSALRMIEIVPAGDTTIIHYSLFIKKKKHPLGCFFLFIYSRGSALSRPMKNSATVPGPVWEPMVVPT